MTLLLATALASDLALAAADELTTDGELVWLFPPQAASEQPAASAMAGMEKIFLFHDRVLS